MTEWEFSDGTIVRLGGDVEGASLFAQELREELARGVLLSFEAHPATNVFELDVNDLLHLDYWLRQEIRAPYRREFKLKLTKAPDNVPPVPPDTRGRADTSDLPDGHSPIY